MNQHLKSDIYHLKSSIALTAESQPLTASFAATIAAAHPTLRRCNNRRLSLHFPWRSWRLCAASPWDGGSYFFILRILAVQLPLYLSLLSTQYSVLGTQYSALSTFPLRLSPVFPPCNAQTAKAAAMTEPTAALGGSSRASRLPMTHIQRLLPSFPFVIAAAILPIVGAVFGWLVSVPTFEKLFSGTVRWE